MSWRTSQGWCPPNPVAACSSILCRGVKKYVSALGHAAHAKLLDKYLERIVVRVFRLQDLDPSNAKIEKVDIEKAVGEFRQFLESAVAGDGKSQSTSLEID